MSSVLTRTYPGFQPLPYEPPPEASTKTLADAFDELVLPELVARRRKPDTVDEYRLHLRRWEDYWKARQFQVGEKHRISNPVLLQINRRLLVEWRGHLTETLGGSNRNVNKHLGTAQAILAAAVKHGWLYGAPKLEPLPHAKAARKLYLSYEQLGRLYDACAEATWPPVEAARGPRREHPPAVEWRAALVLFFNYGFRTQELIRFESDMRTLTWGNVTFDAATPAEGGQATCEHGWLWYVPQKQEWQKDEPLVLPLNAVARAHLESVRPRNPDPRRPVFDWPLCHVHLYSQWRRLLAIADLRPKPNLKTGEQEEYHFKHLRKSCVTWHNYYCPGIAPYITGHAEDRDEAAAGKAASRVSATHYDNPEQVLVRVLNEFPQPEQFRAILARPA